MSHNHGVSKRALVISDYVSSAVVAVLLTLISKPDPDLWPCCFLQPDSSTHTPLERGFRLQKNVFPFFQKSPKTSFWETSNCYFIGYYFNGGGYVVMTAL